MSRKTNLMRLLAAIPAILMMTFMRVFIASTVAFFVLVQLASSGFLVTGKVAAILTAVVVFFWPDLHYKFKAYILSLQERTEDE